MYTLSLRNGLMVFVDDQDYPLVSPFNWRTAKSGRNRYAIASVNGRQTLMHRLIMSPPENMVVDHINHNGLDNRRQNLRIVTLSENIQNQRLRVGKKYHGVRNRCKCLAPWEARLWLNGKLIEIGVFATPEQAAAAYDEAVLSYGDAAKLKSLNFSARPEDQGSA